MFISEPVEMPAVCKIVFGQSDVMASCVVRLTIEDGKAYILFSHDAGVIGFGGDPQANTSVRVNVAGTDEHVIPADGLCMIDGDKGTVGCTAMIGNRRLTVAAKSNWDW